MGKLGYVVGAIIAVDFDGTLCEGVFPDIGKPNTAVIDKLKFLKGLGVVLILWTCREGEYLERAVAWCKAKGLCFDAVNENVRVLRRGGARRKIYADYYLDDRSLSIGAFLEMESL